MRDATLASKKFARRTGINDRGSARLSIVVEELVTNLYDHGDLGLDDVFHIELSATPTDISLVLIDAGTPFDPRQAQPDCNVASRGAGAGLKLVRAWATSTDYQRTNGLNRFVVVLQR